MVGRSLGGAGPAIIGVAWLECGIALTVLSLRCYIQANGVGRLGWDLLWASVAMVHSLDTGFLELAKTTADSGNYCIDIHNLEHHIRYWKPCSRRSSTGYCYRKQVELDSSSPGHHVEWLWKVRRRCAAAPYSWANWSTLQGISPVPHWKRLPHQLCPNSIDFLPMYPHSRAMG